MQSSINFHYESNVLAMQIRSITRKKLKYIVIGIIPIYVAYLWRYNINRNNYERRLTEMKKIKLGLYLLLPLLILGQSACSSTTEEKNNKLQIYTTIFALEEFASYIGGDYVEVINLIPNGADAHTFEPSSKQIVSIANADAFLFVGIGMEGFIDRLSNSLENENVTFVKVSEGIDFDAISINEEEHDDSEKEEHDDHEKESHDDHEMESHDDHEKEAAHNHEGEDPHIWLDPLLASQLAENIKDAFIELLPEQQELFEKNFHLLQGELNQLNNEFTEVISNSKNKSFIVSHGAYGYWENRYGLEQKAITGLSPEHEPSQKQLQELVDYAIQNNLQYILFEQNVTPRVAEVLQKEINAKSLTLHNLSVRTKQDNEEDYFSLMRKNIQTLKKALN
jgi:zinc transport system substrate-binding protein